MFTDEERKQHGPLDRERPTPRVPPPSISHASHNDAFLFTVSRNDVR
jgi:hypothetical protein